MSARRLIGALIGLLLVIGLAGCGSNDEKDASQQPQGAALRITLGTPAFPEARILGELWKQALAVNGYAVDLRKDVGPAGDLDTALHAGEIDGYVAYTGTVLSVVAGQEVSGLDPNETYQRAKDFYDSQGMFMSKMTPFENTDAIAVTKETAAVDKLAEIGDLRTLDSFVLGARPEFENLYLGFQGLKEVYGLTNGEFRPIPLGEQYAALDEGEVDAVNAFTTDPQLRSGEYALLKDPELLFGSQNVTMVVSKDKLERIDSEDFLAVVDAVNAQLTTDAIVDLNAEVTAGRKDSEVARDFLRSANLSAPLRN
jgi:glycine betaine/choline ABC-type transport system substrate-binding protein